MESLHAFMKKFLKQTFFPKILLIYRMTAYIVSSKRIDARQQRWINNIFYCLSKLNGMNTELNRLQKKFIKGFMKKCL